MRVHALLLSVGLSCTGPQPPAPHPPDAVRLLVDGSSVAFHDPQVLSIDDANEHFQVILTTEREMEPGHTIGFMLGDSSLPASDWGRNGETRYVVVPATAPQARAIAAALGVPARDREPWRGELAGRLEPPAAIAAGAEHVPMRFHLTNTGHVALWFLDGGRGRNQLGRDNRFTIEIERDGERLPVRRLEDFGGLGVYRRLEPTATWTLQLDLAHWCPFDRPGQYRVRASYEAELMPADYEPGKAQPMGFYAHLRRTRTVTADQVVEVR